MYCICGGIVIIVACGGGGAVLYGIVLGSPPTWEAGTLPTGAGS